MTGTSEKASSSKPLRRSGRGCDRLHGVRRKKNNFFQNSFSTSHLCLSPVTHLHTLYLNLLQTNNISLMIDGGMCVVNLSLLNYVTSEKIWTRFGSFSVPEQKSLNTNIGLKT